MSETPDVAADDNEDIDAELPETLPEEAPEADVIEQHRDVRAEPDAPRPFRPDPAVDEADEADRQEQSEVVSFDEEDETR